MHTRMASRRGASLLLICFLSATCGLPAAKAFAQSDKSTDARTLADSILKQTAIQGGVVVHVGCADGQLTSALRANERYLVHGLASDAQAIATARKHIRSQGLYGKVSVELFEGGRLPYSDNLVNLLVIESRLGLTDKEIDRVLCPEGVAYIKQGESWISKTKPRPGNIDEWTHFLHDPSNNSVAKDSVVGPPRHLQWVGGPKWARGHEVLATVSAVVSAGGRIFYIADEGPIASVNLPSKWTLFARDAFNGVLLWQKAIPRWETEHRPFRSGPTDLPRRLVAVGDEVYVTLGYGEPLVALDAATGEIKRTYQNTEGTEEVIVAGGKIFLVIGDLEEQRAVDAAVRRGESVSSVRKEVVALDAKTGDLLWHKTDDDTADLFGQTLAVMGDRVVLQNTRAVVCLDANSGTPNWRTPRPSSVKRPAWSVPTLVVYDDIVMSADREAPQEVADDANPQKLDLSVTFQGGQSPPGELVAFSAETGEKLWSTECREGYNAPVDVLLTDGLLWTGDLVRARDPGITEARDPSTGIVKRTRPSDLEFYTPGMSHARCYRNRATEKFVLTGRAGVEFINLETGHAEPNHWIRGTCQFGIMPANGLLYVPPHTCACYMKTKLNGFNALASSVVLPTRQELDVPRLQTGPAYDRLAKNDQAAVTTRAGDWPMYRRDAERSGSTTISVSAKVAPAWRAAIGGRISSSVVADGIVYVAEVDAHTIHALNASSGDSIWTYTTSGRIDSPPTVQGGRAIFGSADGYVYCLDAANGQLAWRFRAGPIDRRIVVEGALESAWPVHGSVLVQQDRVYFAAGRSSFVDGGIYLYALNPATGDVLSEYTFSGRDPETGEQPRDAISGFDMPTGLPDILTGDGESVYMRDVKFNADLALQPKGGLHLFSPTGFLDDSWWHRSYWLFGDQFRSGWGGWHQSGNQFPAGRLLVCNDNTIYGFGRNIYPRGNAGQWTTGEYYRLFSASKTLKMPEEAPKPAEQRRGKKAPPKSLVDLKWEEKVQPEVRAMVLAGDTLFFAGPHGSTHESLAAYEGHEGISLQAVSTVDGTHQATHDLDSQPVFDGLSAAQGRLYLSTKSGEVICFAAD